MKSSIAPKERPPWQLTLQSLLWLFTFACLASLAFAMAIRGDRRALGVAIQFPFFLSPIVMPLFILSQTRCALWRTILRTAIWGAVAAAVVANHELLGSMIRGVLDSNIAGIAYGTTVMLWVGGALAWNVGTVRCFMIGHRKVGIASALLLSAWWGVLLWHFLGFPDLT